MTLVIDIFRVLASCTSMMMILSPAPTVYRIYKTQKTGHASIFPLIAQVFNCHTWMLYGYLEEIYFPVFTTFIVGDLIALCYVAIFYRFTSNRDKAHRLLALFGAALAGATLFAIVGGAGLTGQTRHEAGQFAGFIAIASSLVLYTAPLEKVRLVFKHESAVFLPIHMVLAGSLNNIMWIIYTSLTARWLMFVPNVVTLTAGLFQVVLYFFVYHPKSHPFVDKSQERPSTATTEDDESEPDEANADDAGSLPTSLARGYTQEYVAIATPTAAAALSTPEMLV